jgi:hypothetical protein
MTPQIIKEKGTEKLRTCWPLFRRHHSMLLENKPLIYDGISGRILNS